MKKNKFLLFNCIFVAVIVILNLFGTIDIVADLYTSTVFRLWVNTYGRFSGMFPFSVGGVLIVIGIILIFVFLIALIVFLVGRKKEKIRKITVVYFKVFLEIVLAVVLIMTLNCTIPYNVSKLHIGGPSREYSFEELKILRNYIVSECNSMSEEFLRDEEGVAYINADIEQLVKKAMQHAAPTFPRLRGFYPRAKYFLNSDVMYYAGYTGMYYPFSMEATITSYISNTFYPYTLAHEYAHIKGCMYESEANYLAFYALLNSGNEFLKYSAYIGVLNYVNNDFYDTLVGTYGREKGLELYFDETNISREVLRDDDCYKSKAYLLDEKEESLASEAFNTVENNLYDAAMQFYNYEPDYSEVTLYLLKYYDGLLY